MNELIIKTEDYQTPIIKKVQEIQKLTYAKGFLKLSPFKNRKYEIILEQLDNIIKRLKKIK